MSSGQRGFIAAGRLGLLVCSLIVLAATGVIWSAGKDLNNGFGRSLALQDSPGSSDGAQNILLMGLDTRKDRNGEDLPADVLRQLHARDSSDGGYNTNTLILVHIPADRKNIVAFSIPRDDLVPMQGLDVSQAKIKEAYGRKKASTEQRMMDQGVTDGHVLESSGREAGRAQTLQTVRELTGVQIDRFAEVSLVGFYDIGKALGGVPVCLNHAVSDDYSGARFPAGRQTLDAAQALAFVRQRHGLDNGDLDRTHRQQAFLVSVLHQLQSSGTFTDIGKLNALKKAIGDDVVLSDGWDITSWAQQLASVDGQHISFRTLPVERYAEFDGQDVNIVDTDAIRDEVQTAFGMRPPRPSQTATASTSESGTETTTSANVPAPNIGESVTSGDSPPCVN